MKHRNSNAKSNLSGFGNYLSQLKFDLEMFRKLMDFDLFIHRRGANSLSRESGRHLEQGRVFQREDHLRNTLVGDFAKSSCRWVGQS